MGVYIYHIDIRTITYITHLLYNPSATHLTNFWSFCTHIHIYTYRKNLKKETFKLIFISLYRYMSYHVSCAGRVGVDVFHVVKCSSCIYVSRMSIVYVCSINVMCSCVYRVLGEFVYLCCWRLLCCLCLVPDGVICLCVVCGGDVSVVSSVYWLLCWSFCMSIVHSLWDNACVR